MTTLSTPHPCFSPACPNRVSVEPSPWERHIARSFKESRLRPELLPTEGARSALHTGKSVDSQGPLLDDRDQ